MPPACIRVALKFLRGLFLFSFLLLVRVPQLGQIVIHFLDVPLVLLAGLFWILFIPKNASQKDIKKAYHSLAKQWHPDKKKAGKKEEATEKFKRNSDTSREERKCLCGQEQKRKV